MQAQLNYSQSNDAYIVNINGKLFAFYAESIAVITQMPSDAVETGYDSSFTGRIDYLKFKNVYCPVDSFTLILALCDVKIYHGE